MKFRAHDTFAIRKGWLHKGLRHVIDNPRIFVDKDVNPMDEFGIGANMVKALRYWLQATGLTSEGTGNTRNQTLTPFGEMVWEYDQYLEEEGTLFLLHYFLSTSKDMATAWYYFFNEYKMTEISEENFVESVKTFLLQEDEDIVSDRALTDDFDCIIKTYTSSNTSTPENNIECPLCELSLISVVDKQKKKYVKKTPRTINPLIILAVIINENKKANGEREIKISKLESDPCNIGKVFNLDELSIAQYLDKLQNMELIKVNRTAGLDNISLVTSWDFNQCIQEYYRSIND